MIKTVTDWDIQAYLDNELSPEDQKDMVRALETDPELRRRFNEYSRQKALLQTWWKDH